MILHNVQKRFYNIIIIAELISDGRCSLCCVILRYQRVLKFVSVLKINFHYTLLINVIHVYFH